MQTNANIAKGRYCAAAEEARYLDDEFLRFAIKNYFCNIFYLRLLFTVFVNKVVKFMSLILSVIAVKNFCGLILSPSSSIS